MKTKIVNTQEELNKVFELRYKVYVEEKGFSTGIGSFEDNKIMDSFDFEPNTINLVMLDGDEAVGTVRFTVNSNEEEKLPCDKLYDFNSIRLLNKGLIAGNVGMLAIKQSHRSTKNFISLMLLLGQELLRYKNDYFMFTLNNECSNLICRIMGAKILSDKFWSDEIRCDIVPMILYKNQIVDSIKKFRP